MLTGTNWYNLSTNSLEKVHELLEKSLEKVYVYYEKSLEKVLLTGKKSPKKVQEEVYMFKRKIMSEFETWKNTGGKKKALVVKGLRQIGKTYSVREFAKANYKNIVYVNFKENESAKTAEAAKKPGPEN